MKRSDITTIIALLVVAALVQAARVLVPESSVWSGLSGPQTAAFPLFLAALWRLAIRGLRVPRGVLVLSALCALGAVGFSYAWRGDRRTDFLVARLRGDAYEAESKILRDRINEGVPADSPVRAVRYYREIVRHAEAKKALRKNRDVPAIVWGGGKFLSISFPTAGGLVSVGDIAPDFPAGRHLMLATKISRIDMSFAPERPSAAFIGALFAGLLPEERVPGGSLPGGRAEAELALRSAGLLLERWSSFVHRAYAAFAVSNHYVVQALRSGAAGIGELRCAVSIYRYARTLFAARENPELAMALANNEAVAAALLGFLEGDRGAIARARSGWKLAARGPKDQRRLQGAPLGRLAARLNLASEPGKRAAKRVKKRPAQVG